MEWVLRRRGFLARWEQALVVLVAAAIIVLNKAVIRDHGSTWPDLVLFAGYAGLVVVLLVRVARQRTRRRRLAGLDAEHLGRPPAATAGGQHAEDVTGL